jgi:hypothetical protein
VEQKKEEAIDSLVELTKSYRQEAEVAKQNRMRLDRVNFDCYHLRQDFSHKQAKQSREFIPKQAMAIEQIVTFIQQGIADVGDWFSVDSSPGVEDPLFTSEEVKLLLSRALDQVDYLPMFGDSIKLGLLQSLAIAKVHGKFVPKPTFYTEAKLGSDGKYKDVLKRKDRYFWVPQIDLIRAEDFYPDPTGNGMYLIHETYMDMKDLYDLSEGENAIYDRAEIDKLVGSYQEADMQSARKSRETGQNVTYGNYRRRVCVWECWGNVIDQQTGKLIERDVVWAIADKRATIRKPTPWPFWHGKNPIIAAPFLRVPHSVWHKSLMDGPSMMNLSLNELYNLMVDEAMNGAHGIKQIRPDWLEDTTQISNGIYPGITLKVSGTAPIGAKVLERVDTSSLSPQSVQVFQMMQSEFSAAALTNDLRMGVLPNRQVKATEVVEASQSITSVFTGIAKVLEASYVEPILEMLWMNMLQHMDDLDSAEVADLIGKDRALKIAAISKEERFARGAQGYKFKVFGISKVLAKQKDFKKVTALLQTIASSDLLMEEFMKKYSVGSLLTKIIKSLDITVEELKQSEEEAAEMEGSANQGQPVMGNAGPDMQSQIPQVAAGNTNESVESMIPRANFQSLEGKMGGGIK